ncbi:hypothetical protein BCR43DRAFT_81690 [Syncephalastrum racemosum]|uniref:Uncharacterized protein n=1 Tax=Syncephalastrum racemosum TaxID=13706 RepID=A0A1X2H2U5_SYNRA|nr:hypothetical protein BCR43DRAFT_81690 [Syncephalastrum racemosum]
MIRVTAKNRGPATNHSLHQRSRSAGDMDMLHQQHPQQKRPTMPVTARSSSSSSSSAASSGTRTPPLASSMIPSRAMTPNSKPQYSHLHPQPRANAAAANTHHRRSTGNMDGIMSSARPVATTVQPRTKPVSRPASTVYGYHPQQQQQQQQEVYRRSMDIDLLYQQQQQMQQQMQTYPHSMYAHGTNAMLRPGKQHGRPSSDLLMPPQRQPTPQPALSYYSPQPSRRSLAAMVDGVQQQDHRHKKPQKSRHQRNGSHTHVSGGSGYVYDQTSTNARRRAEMRRMDPMPTQTRSTPQPSYNMNNMNNMNNMMPMTQQAYLPGTYGQMS